MLDLQSLSSKFNIAVIVTNHLTTFLEFSHEDGSVSKGFLVPSLGDSFTHLVGNRLMLGCAPPTLSNICHRETPYLLMITKSSVLPEASAMFQIEDGGIRDVT
ncbi:hypothetical protein J437_LFUL003121 [Ladona fulva]|uniref:Rad51-like C-terminal domain-containing protein n=1 Tax=Ladona fulva TaxID=123851 RepID=A0A8K0JW39_LADFU|nr:hypothetical protein J437_LFUL003121 [Ladona fulva]